MRCSRKFSTLLVCLALAAGAIAAKKDDKPKDGKPKEDAKKESGKKKDKGDAKKPAATPAPEGDDAAKPRPKLSLPLAKGYDSKDVRFPYNDGTGKKTMTFQIGVATRLDDDHVRMKQLLIETFNDETSEKEMTITMPTAMLDLNTRIITTNDSVTIKRSDFELTGKIMEFNTETKQGRLQKDVKMVIYNMQDTVEPKPEAKAHE
jgi:hypothetical protein